MRSVKMMFTVVVTLAAVIAATLASGGLAAQADETPAPSGQGVPPSSAVEVSQSEPDPALEPIPVGDNVSLAERTERRGCTSNIRWLGFCAFAGYALPRNCKQAWCGLLGSLVTYTQAYRVDPGASNRPGRYKPVSRMVSSKGRKGGHCNWKPRRGHMAAYLLSKYGNTGANNRRAASVDLALHHILCAKKWDIGGKATKKRLSQAARSGGFGKKIRKQIVRRAHKMVKLSRRQAGPYRLKVTSPDAAAGETVTVTARLRSASGRAAANRKVTMTLNGTTTDAYTNARGKATWTFTMEPGNVVVRIQAPQLQSHFLTVRQPKKARSARVFLAGRTVQLHKKLTVTTKQRPTLTVTGSNARIPDPLTGTISYSGSLGTQNKTTTTRMYGPFAAASNARCKSSALLRTWTFDVSGDGSYDLPAPGVSAKPRVGGWYVFGTTVAEDTQNTAVSVCGSPLRLSKAQPSVDTSTMEPTANSSVDVDDPIRPASFAYRGGVGDGSRAVSVVLWGPFDGRAQSSCAAGAVKQAREADWALKGNDRYQLIKPGRRVKPAGAGWYRFGIVVAGDAANESVRVCGPAFKAVVN